MEPRYNILKDAFEGLDTFATVKVLLDYGMSANPYIYTHTSLLDKAVQMGKCDVAELLLDHGAGLDCKRFQQVLVQAIKNDDPDMISLLIKHGASMENTNAFDLALVNRRIASARKLLELGADINGMSAVRHHRKGGTSKVKAGTPLHRVIGAAIWKPGATCSRKEMVRFLLENGANTDIVYGRHTVQACTI
ncbi:hypothetical protein SMAC_05199 [Paecilomyces variotii No. 5]|uniref:Uncharacterized protein n=1 Tax=Byssochlamys spectabilis (strain No. 5 / NBRC 109023) TaxID=1356009 RepID=V5FAB3_BYSSN|nr:hypothetical protein SMAC_05199 [Paecilomyces variotii No. 5]